MSRPPTAPASRVGGVSTSALSAPWVIFAVRKFIIDLVACQVEASRYPSPVTLAQ